MKGLRVFVCLAIGIVLCSCSQGKKGNPPPSPPDPFPIELETAQQQLNRLGDRAEMKLNIAVRTNVEYNSSVIIRYSLYDARDSQRLIETQELFHAEIPVHQKVEMSYTIKFERYGTYSLEINAEYNGAGQRKQYAIRFDEQELRNTLY